MFSALRSLFFALFSVLSGVSAYAEPVHELVANFENAPMTPSSGALVLGPDGNLWGTSEDSGFFGCGTVYKLNPATGLVRTVVDFSYYSTLVGRLPGAGLVSDGIGFMWGTNREDGSGQLGTLFKVEVATGVLTTVASFTGTSGAVLGSDARASLVSDGNGFLWGATSAGGAGNMGTLFKVNVSTGAFTTLVEFTADGANSRGASPEAALVSDGNGFFWGTTSGGGAGGLGTVFKVDIATGALATIVEFSGNGPANKGSTPRGLVKDASGFFWGTTAAGGALDKGTVFKLDAATGALTTLVEFTGAGPTNRGAGPSYGALVSDGSGSFWGTTKDGGATISPGVGTVFKINAASGQLTTVVDFGTPEHIDTPVFPTAGLMSDGNGFMWGTTLLSAGWYSERIGGSVFKVAVATGVMTTVVDIKPSPIRPEYELVSDDSGVLWGVTGWGGTHSSGTVFKVDPPTGTIRKVADFGRDLGGSPTAGLVRDSRGFLWGVASHGGSTFVNGRWQSGYGTVVKVDPVTETVTTVVTFTGTVGANKGASPSVKLVDDGNGFMWGSTELGGAWNRGTIFKVNATTGVLTTLVEFTGFDGGSPHSLANDGNGFIWAVAGSYIVKVNTLTSELTHVSEFSGDAALAKSRFAVWGASDGRGFLWGTTRGSAATGQLGTVFKVDAATGERTTVVEFPATGGFYFGASPNEPLVNDGNGSMWGTTSVGGAIFRGTVFKVDIETGVLTTVVEFTGFGNQPRTGSNPTGGLLKQRDGYFYGMTAIGGPTVVGTVFRVGPVVFPPEVTLAGEPGIVVEQSSSYTDAGATARDLQGNVVTPIMTSNTVVPDVQGTYYVTWSATDSNGLTSTARRTVKVVGPLPTVTGVFSPLRVLEATRLPDYRSQAVTTNFAEAPMLTQTPAPGTTMWRGIVLVSITATDTAGNSATTRFRVVVPKPTISGVFSPLHALAGTQLPNYRSQAVVNDLRGDHLIVIQVPGPGTVMAVGTTTVTVRAINAAGESAETSFEVVTPTPTVGGVFSPLNVFARTPLPDYTAQLVPSNFAETPAVTQSPAPGTPTAFGTTSVTLTALDALGNTAETTFQIAVGVGDLATTVLGSKGAPVPGAGQPGSGIPAGATWRSFGAPSINDAGQALVHATLNVGAQRTTAILGWDVADTADTMKCVALAGDPAPGITNAVMASFGEPLLGPDGSVSWLAKLANAPVTLGAVTSTNNLAVVLDADGAGPGLPVVVARKGQSAGDAGVWKAFTSVALGGKTVAFTATLAGVHASENTGLWLFDRASGSAALALQEGAPMLGSSLKTITALVERPSSAGQGRGLANDGTDDFAAVRVTLADSRQAIATITNQEVVFNYVAGGDAVGYGPGAKWRSFGLPTQSEGSATQAFVGRVKSGTGTATAANDTAIFAESDGELNVQKLAAKGDAAAGVEGGAFAELQDPVSAENSSIAFIGKLTNAARIGSANNDGIWQFDVANGLRLVAREGAQPPNMPAGTRWKSFESIALPASGSPIFVATLHGQRGAVSVANDVGLWATDSSGELRLLLREGDAIGSSTVKTFTVLSSVTGSPAQTRSFNRIGSVIVRATDMTGAQHLLHIAVP